VQEGGAGGLQCGGCRGGLGCSGQQVLNPLPPPLPLSPRVQISAPGGGGRVEITIE